jgi:RNA polymerase sigma-70 factor (ECF subfamily)
MRAPFEDLMIRYEREIYRFATRLTGNAADAADVLQDTFLRAFRAFPRLPGDANHRAWLYRIAGRSASNLRRSRRLRRAAPLEAARGVARQNGDAHALLETRHLARALAETVRSLPARQRSAFVQRKYEGRSYAEIAVVLDCSEESARAHVYQAMNRIRHTLAGVGSRRGSAKRRTR